MGLLSRGISTYSAAESLNQHLGNRIAVTPTLSADAYTANDLFFESVEIPDIVGKPGGTSRIVSISCLFTGEFTEDWDLVFMKNDTSFGDVNASSWGATVLDTTKAGIFGAITLDQSSMSFSTIGTAVTRVFSLYTLGEGDVGLRVLPIIAQAAPSSTSIYAFGILRSGTPTVATDALTISIGVEYR